MRKPSRGGFIVPFVLGTLLGTLGGATVGALLGRYVITEITHRWSTFTHRDDDELRFDLLLQ